MESGGIFSTNRIFVEIVLQIGSIELLQGLIQVLRAVYIDAILLYHHPRKSLAILGIHVFQERPLR